MEHQEFPSAGDRPRDPVGPSARPAGHQPARRGEGRHGRLGGALTTYASPSAKSRSETAHYSLALQQAEAGDLPSARQSLAKALALQPDYAAAKAVLASVETRSGHPVEALRLARELRTQYPDAPDGALLEGEALLTQKDAAGAVKAYAAAFEKAPTPDIFIKLHRTLLQAGKTREADQQAAEWIAKSAGGSKVRLYLAQVDLAAGRKAQAIGHYEALLQAEPAHTVALNNLAWLYRPAGRRARPAAAERAYKSRPGDAVVADTMGWILLEQGNVERGLPLLKEAVAKAPKAPVLQYHLAAGYAKAGDKARARDTLDALLASKVAFPERAEATALRAQL